MNKEDNSTLLVARYYDPDKRREFYAEGFREEGRKEGREEGRLLGRKEESFKVVLNMLKNKFKINDIVMATGLSKEEILKLKEEK